MITSFIDNQLTEERVAFANPTNKILSSLRSVLIVLILVTFFCWETCKSLLKQFKSYTKIKIGCKAEFYACDQ